MTGDFIRIAELARRTGIKMSTLRHYERIGLIDVDRSQGPHSHFPRRAIEQALKVQQLLREHTSVEEIRRLIDWGKPTGPGAAASAIDLKELARLTGYSFTTLRYYIRHGLIEYLHSKANYLSFSECAVEQCLRVVQLRGLGLTLAEMKSIAEMFRFPQERDLKALQLMTRRLESVAGRRAVLEELEQRIRIWLDSSTNPRPESRPGTADSA